MKRITKFSAACALISAAILGCSAGSAEAPTIAAVTQKLYQTSAIVLEGGSSQNLLVENCGDLCYMFYKSSDSDLVLAKIDSSGEITEQIDVCRLSGIDAAVDLNDNGSFDVITAKTDFAFEYDENGDISNYDDFIRSAELRFELVSYDALGHFTGSRQITGLDEYYTTEGSGFLSLESYGSGKILSVSNGIVMIDRSGNVTDGRTDVSHIRFGRDSKDNVIALDMMPGVMTLDGKSLKLPEREYSVELDTSVSRPVKGRDGYRLFLAGQDKLFGITETGEVREVMDFPGSFIEKCALENFCCIGDGIFVSGDPTLYTRRPVDYVSERKELRLGGNTDPNVILQFNRSSDNYTISLSSPEDFEHLSRDILIDNAPDIIEYNAPDTMYRLTNMGGLLDLSPMLDGELGIGRDEIMPNILTAYEHKGRIYALPESFTLDLVIADRNYIGTDSHTLSADDFFTLYSARLEGMELLYDQTGYMFIKIEPFIDMKKGSCRFDSPQFSGLLGIAADVGDRLMFSTSCESEDDRLESTKRRVTALRDHTAMLACADNIGSPDDLCRFAASYGLTWDDSAFLYPIDSEHGYISSDSIFSITANCEYPEGAWEFISFLLGEDRQYELINANPVNKNAFERNIAKCIERDKTPRIGQFHLDNVQLDYRADLTKAQYEEYTELVMGCDSLDGLDTSIVSDEYVKLEGGETTAEECASMIQNRMEIFLSERS